MDVAVVYCRKSNESALPTDVSFDIQESECEKYAKEKGYRIGRVIKESHTGADLLGRPGIWEAIEEVEKGRAQVLLVRNYDRLARKIDHQGVILYHVEEKHGGRVEAALEPYDPNDISQKMMRTLAAMIAEGERANVTARMERGKRYRAERGSLMGACNPLFGYAWADDVAGERTRYMEDPETALVVKRIYKLATTGYSLRRIARLLNDEGVPTPAQWAAQSGHIGRRRVGTVWMTEMVRRIIQDHTYTGEMTAYRYKRVRGKNGKYGHVRNTEGNVALQVPALVDEATWRAANNVLGVKEGNGRPPTDREATWLRHHVYCGVCGSKMIARRPTGYDGYVFHCSQRASTRTDGKGCSDFSIRAHLLDNDVYAFLARWVQVTDSVTLRQKMIERLGLNKVAALQSVAEGHEAQLTAKRAEYETCRRRARQTTDDALAADLMRDAEGLNKEIAALEAEYRDTIDQRDNFSSGIAWVDATLERIKHGLDIENPTEADIRGLPYEERRLLLAACGVYVTVWPLGYPQRIAVESRFDMDVDALKAFVQTLPASLSDDEMATAVDAWAHDPATQSTAFPRLNKVSPTT